MAEIDFSLIKCKQPECKVSTTGVCMEGIPLLDNCSHILRIQSVLSEENNEEQNNEEKNFIELPEDKIYFSGDALLIEECNKVTSSSLTRLIVLAGSAKSGKTTLLASLFQLFQDKNSFVNYKFAGSLTLIGLEKRCFKSRIASERDVAETDRTIKLEYDEFIHLKVKGGTKKVSLLFTDVSGEKFKDLSNSQDECRKFDLVKRADHFALFIDAFLLSDITTRQTTKTNSLGILRSLIESKMLSEHTYIEVIFSRWDLLLQRENYEDHKKFIESLKQTIIEKFQSTHKRIRFFEIASRPASAKGLDFGYGIDKILPEWVEKSPYIPEELEIPKTDDFLKSTTRELSKFKYF
jgi:GTPase SAR1 family protein